MYKVIEINALQDNYIWALVEGQKCTIVDPGEAEPVLQFAAQQQLTITDILLTHHHADHLGGVAELQAAYPNIKVYGPDTARFKLVTHPCTDLQAVTVCDTIELTIMTVPGHTRDHICYFDQERIFVGDTLFSAGCGRLFEGTPVQMHTSLKRIAALDAHTKVYCAHEYTEANLRFAQAVDGNNQALAKYRQQVQQKRQLQQATIPTDLATELAINPFLRADNKAIQAQLQQAFALDSLPDEQESFTLLRKWKDNF